MTTAPLLDGIKKRTAELVAENLRSTSVVIARLVDLITEANKHGHPHTAIHESIKAGGLDTSMNNYRVYLHRARSGRAVEDGNPIGSTRPALPVDESKGGTQQRELLETQNRTKPQNESSPVDGQDSVLQVREALAGAKQIASTDYSKIAREFSRKPRK